MGLERGSQREQETEGRLGRVTAVRTELLKGKELELQLGLMWGEVWVGGKEVELELQKAQVLGFVLARELGPEWEQLMVRVLELWWEGHLGLELAPEWELELEREWVTGLAGLWGPPKELVRGMGWVLSWEQELALLKVRGSGMVLDQLLGQGRASLLGDELALGLARELGGLWEVKTGGKWARELAVMWELKLEYG